MPRPRRGITTGSAARPRFLATLAIALAARAFFSATETYGRKPQPPSSYQAIASPRRALRSRLGGRPSQIERHHRHQVFVAHLREQRLAAALEQPARQRPLAFDEAIDPLLDPAAAHQLVDEDVPVLADAIGAIGCLVFGGGVPPAVEVHDVSAGSQVEPQATR